MTRAMLVVMFNHRPISVLYKNGDGFPAVIIHMLEDIIPNVLDLVGRTSCPAEEIVSELQRHLNPSRDGEDANMGCCGDWVDFHPCKEGYADLHLIQSESLPDYTYYFSVDHVGIVWVSVNAFTHKGENQIFFGTWRDAIIWKDRLKCQAIGFGYHDELYDTNGNYLGECDPPATEADAPSMTPTLSNDKEE